MFAEANTSLFGMLSSEAAVLPWGQISLLFVIAVLVVALLYLMHTLRPLRDAQARSRESLAKMRTSDARASLLELIIECQQEPIVALDDIDQIIYENAAFVRQFGSYRPQERQLRSHINVDPNDDGKLVNTLALARSKGAATTELSLVSSLGSEPTRFQVTAKKLSTASGSKALLLLFRDVTTEHRLSTSLLRSHKLERLTRLVGSLVHDFNNRLSVIRSGTELISLELPQDHPSQADLSAVRGAVEEAMELVSELLSLARPTHGENGRCSPAETLKGLEKSLRRLAGPGAKLVLDLSAEPLQITLSSEALQEVVLQLAVNAFEAARQGGKVTISVHDEAHDTAVLTVEDNGPGIDTSLRDTLFDPFITTKTNTNHLGLGLSTVRALVEQVGGHVSVQSSAGTGTRFRVHLPKAKDQRMIQSNPPGQDSGSQPNLLVLDDEEPVRRLLVRLLNREGYAVTDASTLTEAITKAKTIERLDVWVTDANVDGTDATDAIPTMRQLHPNVAVVLVSGREPDSDQLERLTLQGVRFLQKPFAPRDLRDAIDEAYRHGSATSAVVPLGHEPASVVERQAR